MPRKPPPSADFSAMEFRQALRANGFAALAHSTDFLDVRDKGPRLARLPGILDPRGRMKRRATLASLLAARARRRAQDATEAARKTAQATLAAALAPVSLPPPRAGLEGAAAIHQLADDFIVIATRSGSAEARSLHHLGWTDDQLETYAADARDLADARQNGAFA